MTALVQLQAIVVGDAVADRQIGPLDLAIGPGQLWQIVCPDDMLCRAFFRLMATLQPARQGSYRFKERAVDFSDYRRLLPVKRQVGYVGPDAALVGNLTVEQNILLGPLYHFGSIPPAVEQTVLELVELMECRHLVSLRPAQLEGQGRIRAVAVREMAKDPELMLLLHPERWAPSGLMDALAAWCDDPDRRLAAVVVGSGSTALPFSARWRRLDLVPVPYSAEG